MAFFWPKCVFDFVTKKADILVKPFPALQLFNLFLAIAIFSWEWPLFILSSRAPLRVEYQLVILVVASVSSAMMYGAGDAAIYYIISISIYMRAYF